jgi:hypothetical protein
MTEALSLANLRRELGRTWLIALFGIAYIISQVTIIMILGPIEDAMVKLQITGVSVGEYLAVFRSWEESGEMAFYRAHFILDDVHWIWYAGLFTTVLCRLFDRHGVGHKYDWVLLLPLGSGLLDWYENQLQHVFLSASDFATIVDPLPLFSTVASDVKWLFSAIYILLTIVLAVGVFLKCRGNKGINKQ